MALRDSNYTIAQATTSVPTVGGYPDPDDGGITWAGLEKRRDFGTHFGGQHLLINFDDYIGAIPGANSPPLAIAPTNTTGSAIMGTADGAQFNMLVGPEEGIPITGAVQHPAAGAWTATKEHALLQTCMVALVPTAATVASIQANWNNAAGTVELDAGEVAAGGIVKGMVCDFIIDGVTRKRTVVEVSGEVLTLHPRLGLDPSVTSVFQIRPCVTYRPSLTQIGNSVDFRLDVNGRSHYANQSVVTSLTFTENADSSTVLMAAAVRPRNNYIFVGNNSGANTYPATPLATPPAGRMQGCFTTTAALATPNATPTSLASIGMPTQNGWNFEINFSATYGEACIGPFNEALPTFTRADVTFTGETDEVDQFMGMILGREERTYTLDFGPTGDGMALIMYAGHLTETTTKSEDGEGRIQRAGFTLRNGTFAGEAGGTGASFAIAIPYTAI